MEISKYLSTNGRSMKKKLYNYFTILAILVLFNSVICIFFSRFFFFLLIFYDNTSWALTYLLVNARCDRYTRKSIVSPHLLDKFLRTLGEVPCFHRLLNARGHLQQWPPVTICSLQITSVLLHILTYIKLKSPTPVIIVEATP